METPKLRQAIAAEAARLIVRGAECEFPAARQRAAQTLVRRKVQPAELPTADEIQSQIYALTGLFAADAPPVAGCRAEDGYHPDTFNFLRLLLEQLAGVRLNPERHPEGDALYHVLQVFELGVAERPYDEEFLLACLLHDVGLAIDRRDPLAAALGAIGGLITERTRWLMEHRPAAREYLETGRIARSLRRSEQFEELVLLARCDCDGRVPGATVRSLEEALGYIVSLSTAWDDV